MRARTLRRKRHREAKPDELVSKCALCDWTFERRPRDGHRFTPAEYEAAMHSWQVAIRHHFTNEHPEHAP